MIKTLLLGIAILFIAIMLMGIKVFFTKKNDFFAKLVFGNFFYVKLE